MAGTDTAQEEVQLHREAYLQIFQAVLKKLPLDDAGRQDRLGRLKSYLDQNIQSTEDFINHIPDFARGLGVKEAALSSFVGGNFMKALTMVKQRRDAARAQAEAGGAVATAAGGGAPAGQAYATVIAEILGTLGNLVQPPDHFELFEAGLLKFVTPDGEVLPQSYAPTTDAGGDAPAGAAPDAPSAANTGGSPAAKFEQAAKAKPAPVAPPERPIIAEILEEFGNHLDIPGKLEPSSGLEAAPAEADATAAPDSPDSPAGEDAAPAVRSTKTVAAPPERGIIEEILEEFGNVLAVHEKLVPTTGLESASPGEAAAPAAASTDADFQESSAPTQDEPQEIDPIPLDFNGYIAILQKLQQFQQSGDQAAYRQWLQGPAGAAGKTIVGLRNSSARARSQSTTPNWPDEYRGLAAHMPDASPEQVEELHKRTRIYGQIQGLVTKLKAGLKTKSPQFKQAIKTIWPSVVLLFNEHAGESEYLSQFRVTLLQVADPALKQELEAFMQPILAQLAELYSQLD